MIETPFRSGSPIQTKTLADRSAVFALGRVEAIRLLRHPVMLGAFLSLAAAWSIPALLNDPADAYPIMHEVNQSVQLLTAFLLGGAALIVSHLAVIRDAHHRSEALVSVLVLERWQRLLAHLLALVPLALLAGLLAVVRVAMIGANPNAVGRVAAYEQAVGPLAVVLLGAGGILLGCLTTLTVIGPLVVVLLTIATLGSTYFAPGNGLRLQALLPVTYGEVFVLPIPGALADRRDDWHLLYLVAATLLIGVIALLASGYRARWVKAGAVVAAVSVGSVAWIQVLPIDSSLTAARAIATNEPSVQQVCERRSNVTYCVWPEFRPWIASWERVVRGVLAQAPDEVASRPLAVRQRVNAAHPLGFGAGSISKAPVASWSRDDERAGIPDAVIAETAWGSPEHKFGLAARLAYTVVSGKPPAVNIAAACGSQALITLWLAVRADESVSAALEQVRKQGGGGLFLTTAGFGTGVAFTYPAIVLLQALLELPVDLTQSKIRTSWAQLVDPSTTLRQAAVSLGLPVSRIPAIEDSRCGKNE
ncbi:hypothetical protein [Micromonospora sp. DT233]|uniref:hypothetical protein n=1 Tax=Micromonospora sp. DT233 TaxID=3393432 RepID=UPI003CF0E2AF